MRLHVITAIAVLGTIELVGPSASQEIQGPAPDNHTALVALSTNEADSVLGKEVRSKTGENMGRLIDIVVDTTGRPRAAIIDFGGFLGVGSRKIAIDWNTLSFEPEGRTRDYVAVDLTREQMKSAPEYKDKRTVLVLSSAASLLPAD